MLDELKPLEKSATQPYFSKSIQLADIIQWILDQIGRSSISISTFSTSEEFLRRLHKFKQKDLIGECVLFCDLRAARKTIALKHFMQSTFDRIFLCENHSKVVLLQSDSCEVAIVTSQNQTRGDRYEAGIITTDLSTCAYLRLAFLEMSQNSISINELLFHPGSNSEDCGPGGRTDTADRDCRASRH